MSRVEQRLRVEPDGSITAFSGKVELGQGLCVAYPRIVAEQLGVSPARVKVVLGDTDRCPWDMGTFGSMSVEVDGDELRRAAAQARRLLLERAAARLGCAPRELTVDSGTVRDAGRAAIGFGELVAEGPLEGEVPETEPFAAAAPLPKSPAGPEAVALVTGAAEFVCDVHLPGMLHGSVLHPAAHGARLRHVEAERARHVEGVVAVVQQGDFVGVVAHRPDQARAALKALNAQWAPPPRPEGETQTIALRDDAGIDEALQRAQVRLVHEYEWPYISAAPLGPSVGVADVQATEVHLFASTQRPFPLRDAVAQLTQMGADRVHVHPRATSGGYGRHGAHDAAIEAARLSKAVGAPVKVQWTRRDELVGAPCRAQMRATLEAGLDAAGQVVAWRSKIVTSTYAYDGATGSRGRPVPGAWDPLQMAVMMAGRNALPAYSLGPQSVTLCLEPAELRTGALRSLGAAPNVFAIESFVDELAAAAGADPIAFRLRHLSDPRLARALTAARDQSPWGQGRVSGRGLGAACALYRNTCVAQVVEVSCEGVAPKLERVFCAVDAGHLVDPDGARNQVEGAIQMGASWALLEELPRRGAEVLAHGWHDYPIARCPDAPRSIQVVFTGDDSTPSYGLGEPAVVPMAPAIASAVCAAGYGRARRLPVRIIA